jgi:hypothetical protein
MARTWERQFSVLLVAFILSLTCTSFVHAALPKNGRVAVVLRGSGGLGKADLTAAGAAVIRELVRRGYPVVDKDRLEALERSEAARLALEGDVEAIMALARKYGVSYYVRGTAEGHKPVVNEFGLYTGTVTISLQAYRARDGKYLFSDSIVGKEVGYTAQEASSKALIVASGRMAAALGDGEPVTEVKPDVRGKRFSLFVSGLAGLVGAESFRQDLEKIPGVLSASLGSGLGTASFTVEYVGDVGSLADRLVSSFQGLVVDSKTPGSLRLRFE